MENKINIAELLKDCPRGMELDYVLCENATFDGVSNFGSYPIRIKTPFGEIVLTKYGQQYDNISAKCVIFPKGKTTWEGFVSPYKYKNGDVVITALGSTAIIKESISSTGYSAHCVWVCGKLITDDTIGAIRFARESEKAELFKAIKDNGFKWDEETKTLKKLIGPKFKVGDKIVKKNGIFSPILITNITDEFYFSNTEHSVGTLSISEQDDWELVQDKFDINTLVPFESKVLVRCADGQLWNPAVYGFTHSKGYLVVGGGCWSQCIMHMHQCIPYEGNEHLLGTTDDCAEYYKTWE